MKAILFRSVVILARFHIIQKKMMMTMKNNRIICEMSDEVETMWVSDRFNCGQCAVCNLSVVFVVVVVHNKLQLIANEIMIVILTTWRKSNATTTQTKIKIYYGAVCQDDRCVLVFYDWMCVCRVLNCLLLCEAIRFHRNVGRKKKKNLTKQRSVLSFSKICWIKKGKTVIKWT